ncbi:BsuPI-related putative proteinase inhibitor [Virgibacillus ainsalahensis]
MKPLENWTFANPLVKWLRCTYAGKKVLYFPICRRNREVLLIAGILMIFLAACQSDKAPGEERNMEEITENGLKFSLQMKEEAADAGKTFTYTVTNVSDDEVKLSFTTSQRYEYELSDEEGVIERFSDGRAFMQVLADITLAPGEALDYDMSLPSLEPGTYTLTVFLTAKDMAENQVTLEFTV